MKTYYPHKLCDRLGRPDLVARSQLAVCAILWQIEQRQRLGILHVAQQIVGVARHHALSLRHALPRAQHLANLADAVLPLFQR